MVYSHPFILLVLPLTLHMNQDNLWAHTANISKNTRVQQQRKSCWEGSEHWTLAAYGSGAPHTKETTDLHQGREKWKLLKLSLCRQQVLPENFEVFGIERWLWRVQQQQWAYLAAVWKWWLNHSLVIKQLNFKDISEIMSCPKPT